MSSTTLASVARFMVSAAPRLLALTPCSLQTVADKVVENGITPSETEAVEAIKELSYMFVNSVILEREHGVGYFLIFYYVQPLAAFVGVALNHSEPSHLQDNVKGLMDFQTSLELLSNEIRLLTMRSTAIEVQRLERIRKRFPQANLTEICSSESRAKCLAAGNTSCLNKIHFEPLMHAHTDVTMGDCSYLDTCFKWRQCKYVHYQVVYPEHYLMQCKQKPNVLQAQYINADLLQLDLKALGNDYAAMIIDPPWEIHTNPGQTNVCTDEKVLELDVGALQKSGIVFLWVTGRVLDAGRQCLAKWGYTHVEEVIWLKTNQLGRTICTGRTGHWLNHTKEHVLVGTKGDAKLDLPRGLDTDVLVSAARGRSQKPEELYAIIDRLVGPEAKKIELFGRKSNVRPGWLTIGNEMGSTCVHDPWLRQQLGLSRPVRRG